MFTGFSGDFPESFWPDSNRRPTHYECVRDDAFMRVRRLTDYKLTTRNSFQFKLSFCIRTS